MFGSVEEYTSTCTSTHTHLCTHTHTHTYVHTHALTHTHTTHTCTHMHSHAHTQHIRAHTCTHTHTHTTHTCTHMHSHTGGGKVSLEFKYDQLISKANKRTLIPLNQNISHPIHQHHRDGTKHQLTNTPGRFQIHIRPLKYSTSELQAKLDLLQPGVCTCIFGL